MKIEICCNYCGYKTVRNEYDESFIRNLSCYKCNDKDLVIKEVSKSKIDYYMGSPPFEENTKSDPEDQRMKETSDLSDMGYLWGMGDN
jgi:hypothetical protein